MTPVATSHTVAFDPVRRRVPSVDAITVGACGLDRVELVSPRRRTVGVDGVRRLVRANEVGRLERRGREGY